MSEFRGTADRGLRRRSVHELDGAGIAQVAQAGEKRLREVVQAGGFKRFRRATETPFNLVLEARL